MQEITVAQLKQLRIEIEEALTSVALRHDIILKGGSGVTHGNTATLKIDISTKENGEVVSKNVVAFKQFAHLFGVKPEDLNRVISVNGEAFQLIGLRPSARVYPFIVKKLSTGKWYKFTEEAVRMALK